MRSVILTLAASILLSGYVFSQDCTPPQIVFNKGVDNIFTPEQETVLGELVLQRKYPEIRFIKDPAAIAYVEKVAASVIRHLPSSGLHYRFHIIDMPEANAFSIPGGHVLLTRKLIAFLKNEDELAAVIAHELGHAVVHHTAIAVSVRMKKILNVSKLGDRNDVIEKYNLLIENARTKKITSGSNHVDDDQLEADRIGTFALVAAGYEPSSLYTFLDRLTESKGKTGGWFSDLFGKTTPDQKRLRDMVKVVERLPVSCRESRGSGEVAAFAKWQAEVISHRGGDVVEDLPGLLWRRELSPKLRSDISRIVVSAMGKYLVTRDDFALTVLTREPLSIAFQIPVEGVEYFTVSNDEKQVLLLTNDLRFERWDIAERKPVEIREVVLRRDCVTSQLSPDGNYLACIDTSLAANIINIATGERIYQKKQFYELNWNEYWQWVLSDFESEYMPFFRIGFTPDSSVAIFSRSNHFRADHRRLSVGSRYATYDTTLAVDIATRRSFGVSNTLDKVFSRAYTFLDAKRVLGMESADAAESGIFTFPEGKRASKFVYYANEVHHSGNPDYLVIRPLRNSAMGIFDVNKASIALGLMNADAGIWRNHIIYESVAGKLVIRELVNAEKGLKIKEDDVASIELPAPIIGGLLSAEVSNNFNWMIMSSATRGGLWNLATGERKLHVTGFRSGLVADDGGAVSEFPKTEDETHSLVLLNPSTQNVGVIRDLPESGAKQLGRFVLIRSSLDENAAAEQKAGKKEKKDEKTPGLPRPVFDTRTVNLSENVRWELKDFVQDKVIWTRDFKKHAPQYAFDDFSGRFLLYWYLGSEAGRERIKQDPGLAAKVEQLANKNSDYLIEVIDAIAGQQLGSVFVETGKGSFHVGGGESEGDWLALYDSEGRILIYSIRSGELLHRFFGRIAALSPVGGKVAVENFQGEVSVYDLATGRAVANFVMKGEIVLLRFDLRGNRLFALSDVQVAYTFDLQKVRNETKPSAY